MRITEPGAVATAFMVPYLFGSLDAVATAAGSVISVVYRSAHFSCDST